MVSKQAVATMALIPEATAQCHDRPVRASQSQEATKNMIYPHTQEYQNNNGDNLKLKTKCKHTSQPCKIYIQRVGCDNEGKKICFFSVTTCISRMQMEDCPMV